MSEAPFLGVYGLSYAYSSGRAILKEISFELGKGELLTLLGPNGSGKSTLMKIVSGVLSLGGPGCSGQIRHLGEDLTKASAAVRARTIAYVGYDFRAEFPVTAYEAVMLARTAAGSGFAEHIGAKDREAVEWAMRECLCWEWRDRDLQTLSGGERQLVSLARALAQGAKILFLDEALSMMDLHHQARIGDRLKRLTREGWSVILVSHDVNLAAEWADSALLMKAGEKLAYGPISQVLNTERLKALYPDAQLFVGRNPATGAPKVFFGTGPNR